MDETVFWKLPAGKTGVVVEMRDGEWEKNTRGRRGVEVVGSAALTCLGLD